MKLSLVTGFMLVFCVANMMITTFYMPLLEASPTILRVPEDYPTIQAAVNAASNDDLIEVHNGTYVENVDVNKRLNIYASDGASITIVKASNSNDHVFEVTANNVTIMNFTVTDATGYHKSGVYLNGVSYCDISNNVVTNNSFGIYVYSSTYNDVYNNIATGNVYHGVHIRFSSNINVTNNDVTLNNGDGVYVHESNYSLIEGNTITNQSTGYGISLHESSFNTITDNDVTSNSMGLVLVSNCNNNTITNNDISQNPNGGIILGSSNNNTIADNTLSLNKYTDLLLYNSSSMAGVYIYSSIQSWPGPVLTPSLDNKAYRNTITDNAYGVYIENDLGQVIHANNLFYDNYFDNALANARDPGNNLWNTTKHLGINIIDGPYIGGNFWSDYNGTDIDSDGIGDTDLPYTSDGNITGGGDYLPLVHPTSVGATIDIDPNTLNLKSEGNWITAYIELPGGYYVNHMNVSTMLLNGTIPVDLNAPATVGDYDGDGVPDLMVKFNRADVIYYIYYIQGISYGNVTLTVTGKFFNGTSFIGSDVIRVILTGDINGDKKVDVLDLVLVTHALFTDPNMGGTLGHWHVWNEKADVNNDGLVDAWDLAFSGYNYGEELP